ncbi:hypothetical protein, partial [Kineococcus glutinatus]|uniref:hypothetical protein n=1 Tax=Kineococcus glutinatus TaxID=1070872 RepID=UPI0031E8FFFD
APAGAAPSPLLRTLAAAATGAGEERLSVAARSATVHWVDVEPGAGGSDAVSVGFLAVQRAGTARTAAGYVTDYRCPAGQLPADVPVAPDPGPVTWVLTPDEEQPAVDEQPLEDPGCQVLAERWLESADVVLGVNTLKRTAVLRGDLRVRDLDGADLGTLPVRLTLAGAGPLARFSASYTWDDGTTSLEASTTGRGASTTTATGSVGSTRFPGSGRDAAVGDFSVERTTLVLRSR